MIKSFIVGLVICFAVVPALADTIDYWHVYLNQRKLCEYNFSNRLPLRLKTADLQPGDTLSVRYFRDVVCPDFRSRITVLDANAETVTQIFSSGSGVSINIPVADITNYRAKTGKKSFDIFYCESAPAEISTLFPSAGVFLFKVELE